MNKKYILAIGIVFVVLIFVLIIATKTSNRIIELTKENYMTSIKNDNFSLVYYGEQSEDNLKKLKKIKDKDQIKVYVSKISKKNYSNLFGVAEVPLFDLFIEGELVHSITDEIDDQKLDETINQYFFNIIPAGERYYKVLTTAQEYINKVNSKKVTVAVFGYAGCSYCNLYLPVFNEVAKEKKLDIYYFDRDTYNEKEYEKIMDLDLTIPGSCTLDNKDTTFKSGFPKPMTIITKNGKLIGCIRGYVKKDVLLDKLEEVGVLK